MAERWIAGAIKRPGDFSRKAKRAGMSTAEYIRHATKEGSEASAQTKRQARLAQTLSKLRKHKRSTGRRQRR